MYLIPQQTFPLLHFLIHSDSHIARPLTEYGRPLSCLSTWHTQDIPAAQEVTMDPDLHQSEKQLTEVNGGQLCQFGAEAHSSLEVGEQYCDPLRRICRKKMDLLISLYSALFS